MKNLTVITIILTFTTIFIQVSAQEDCRVLKPGIDSIYKGKCKKGFAHGKGHAIGKDTYLGRFADGLPEGKGTYTWANGNTYSGEWIEGKRNGEGALIIKMAEKDSIVDGIWEDDEYIGPKPKRPEVITKVGVDRFMFKRLSDAKDRVLINILQNGVKNPTVTNFLMAATNGIETSLGNQVGYEYVDFPITIKVSYFTKNKIRTGEYQVIFEFEISEPGDWRVEIHN